MKKTIVCLLSIVLMLSISLFTMAEETAGDLPGGGGTGGLSAKPLTLEDLGIKAPETNTSKISYLNPRTYVLEADNEDNAHTGNPDYDMNVYLFAQNTKSPIEVRFDLDVLPSRDAYLCVYAWDCDEFNTSIPEYDAVYVNDTKIGALTGEDEQWNTTYWSIPISALKLGANYVTIHIGAVDKTVSPWRYYEYYANRWAIQVKWIQLILDGGDHPDKPDYFSVNLRNATLQNQTVYCEAAVEIESQVARNYEVEYSLVDRSDPTSATYMQIISTDVSNVTGTSVSTYGTLHLPLSSPNGLYSVQVILREQGKSDILATDEKYFNFDGTVPSFDIINLKAELSEEDYTPGPITMYVSADITDPSAISNVVFWLNGKNSCKASIDANGHATGSFTIRENGEYEVEIRYIKDGKELNAQIYIIVANIISTGASGDVNGDGVVDDLDCKLVRRTLLGQNTLTEEQIERGDMDGDGKITGVDYLMIRTVVVGK